MTFATREVSFTYTNHRGETSVRRVEPFSIRFDTSEWHPGRQWLLDAWDLDKETKRSFAMKDISGWSVPEPEKGGTP